MLRGEQITAVQDQSIYYSKLYDQLQNERFSMVLSSGYNPFRYPICEDDTLKEFEYRFNQNDLFRSPSEICSLWLYPAQQRNLSTAAQPQSSLLSPGSGEQPSHSKIKSWWYDNPKTDRKALTGDNVRESPYNHLYPRLTTKSNTYTLTLK